MSTRVAGHTEREDLLVRVLALGAALAALGGALVASEHVPAFERPPSATVAYQVEEELPAYVVAPNVTVDARPTAHPATGRPLWVRVPDLGVSVPVVAIAAAGSALVPPSDPQVLGWWRDGAEPGALSGTAVVTGHTVSTGGGALDHLHRLDRLDRLVVETDAGRITYRVTDVVRYSKPALERVASRVFSQEVPGRLVLVTCTDFDGQHYLANTLVFADPLR
ncbi:MAG TPA: class F sortase [Nocardioidaceae bacterium]|nr:class F sortase [Nocardioidaceae bacterium]